MLVLTFKDGVIELEVFNEFLVQHGRNGSYNDVEDCIGLVESNAVKVETVVILLILIG